MTSRRYIEAPHYHLIEDEPTLFLAGGITNCRDWQTEAVNHLTRLYPWVTILNPRRADWPGGQDTQEAYRQIKWEHFHLRIAKHVLFWFSHETDNPITLLELGYWMNSNKPITVGMDTTYRRRFDVETQLKLSRPGARVHFNLYDALDRAVFDQ